jgi:hypothetical protein
MGTRRGWSMIVCEMCERLFKAKRMDAATCGVRCRTAYMRARRDARRRHVATDQVLAEYRMRMGCHQDYA